MVEFMTAIKWPQSTQVVIYRTSVYWNYFALCFLKIFNVADECYRNVTIPAMEHDEIQTADTVEIVTFEMIVLLQLWCVV